MIRGTRARGGNRASVVAAAATATAAADAAASAAAAANAAAQSNSGGGGGAPLTILEIGAAPTYVKATFDAQAAANNMRNMAVVLRHALYPTVIKLFNKKLLEVRAQRQFAVIAHARASLFARSQPTLDTLVKRVANDGFSISPKTIRNRLTNYKTYFAAVYVDKDALFRKSGTGDGDNGDSMPAVFADGFRLYSLALDSSEATAASQAKERARQKTRADQSLMLSAGLDDSEPTSSSSSAAPAPRRRSTGTPTMQSKDQMRIASLAEEDIEKHICVSDDDNDGDKNYCGDDAMDDDDDDDDECQPKANAKAKAKANAATPASASKTTTKAKSSSKGGAVVDAMGRNADVLASAMTSLGSTLGSSIASVGSSIASAAKPEKSVEMARIEMQRELIAANAKEREEERAARRQETEANRQMMMALIQRLSGGGPINGSLQ